jgi:putative membrane protein
MMLRAANPVQDFEALEHCVWEAVPVAPPPMPPADQAPDRQNRDVTRRTWLAAERTWLAWWRTGIAVAAVSIAVGRFLPGLTRGDRWPYRVLGLGYALLAIAILVVGAVRQRRGADALRRGDYDELASPVVMWMTAAAVALSVMTFVLVAVAL